MSDRRIAKHRGKYVVYWRDEAGQPVRHSLGTTDLGEAERRFLDYEAALKRKQASKNLSIKELWEARREALKGRRTGENMEWSGRSILPFFGPLQPHHVNRDLCREYITARKEEGRKEGTIQTELNHLRQTLNWAVKEGLTEAEPQMVVPPRQPPKVDYLTKEQARLILNAHSPHHIHLFVVLALATGARSTALLELTWDRVDLDRRQINLRTADHENRKGRAIVPINDMAFNELLHARGLALSPFVIEWAGDAVRSVKKGVRSLAKKVGLPWVSPHVFRHSAAVWMAEGGTSMEEIAQYLGHEDVNVTRRTYARFSPDHLRKAAAHLEL